MGIEKIKFIDITGKSAYLDEALQKCLECGMFQPDYASKMSEYSFGTTALLRNPYGGLLIKINEIASQLQIPLDLCGEPVGCKTADRDQFIEAAHVTLDDIRHEYPKYFEKRNKINDEIISYTTAAEMLGHIDEPDINFDELFNNKYLKIRFGRIPTVNLSKLDVYEDTPHEVFKLDSNAIQTWILYFTAAEYRDDIDRIFAGLHFERLRIPDYVHGTVENAMDFLRDGIRTEREMLEETVQEIQSLIDREKKRILSLYTDIKFLHSAYDMRKYVTSIGESFHLVGFVLAKQEKSFLGLFDDLPEVSLNSTDAGSDLHIPPPVKLKNNWFVRPFEMFVNMYGSPSYNDIDPSPFVAYTYSLLFGMMFGDVGQGFCVFLIGLLVYRYKKMQLGQIMSRIGVVSMLFGTLYGSVFGFEHLLDGFYINVLGLPGKPIEVMHPDTTNTILIAAIALGASIILMVIIFNIIVGAKHKDFDRMVLSHNGVSGLMLYITVLIIFFEAFTSTEYLTSFQEAILIGCSLSLMFFREPLVNLIRYQTTSDILKEKSLAETQVFREGSINLLELFNSKFVTARFGRLPTDSYRKLMFYENEPFMLYPVKSSHEYIWCIYASAYVNKPEIDAIFRDLMFERLYIPEEYLKTNEQAENYIKRCVDTGGIPTDETDVESKKYGPVEIEKPKTIMQSIFPEGVGSFFTQTFFELFEVVLSFITNTMSFLRVGGFILAHAGMMAVVFTLAEMVGGGASPLIIVVGNIFVMALEGLIVGIQVLRLEFYEIFSRFFDGAGEPFRPIGTSEK